ncbi:hypothetical protein MVEG_11740 [Podila verticillata NRRL 6337]|uniref:Uncharacterized protein n=1 Tax=Podila verticillata NRRL 6337 TaxID=1069443 RepID=A0A086TJH4_9FUNG|nr:hypothetical protein MVEG_11740 [Podila verticillata NRRL 6337]
MAPMPSKAYSVSTVFVEAPLMEKLMILGQKSGSELSTTGCELQQQQTGHTPQSISGQRRHYLLMRDHSGGRHEASGRPGYLEASYTRQY